MLIVPLFFIQKPMKNRKRKIFKINLGGLEMWAICQKRKRNNQDPEKRGKTRVR